MAERSDLLGTYEFNQFATGARRYGLTGTTTATSGPVSVEGMDGYVERDQRNAARKSRLAAIQKQMRQWQDPRYATSSPRPLQ